MSIGPRPVPSHWTHRPPSFSLSSLELISFLDSHSPSRRFWSFSSSFKNSLFSSGRLLLPSLLPSLPLSFPPSLHLFLWFSDSSPDSFGGSIIVSLAFGRISFVRAAVSVLEMLSIWKDRFIGMAPSRAPVAAAAEASINNSRRRPRRKQVVAELPPSRS